MEVTIHLKENSTPVEVMASKVDPVSPELRQLLQVIIYLFMCGFISLFGIGTNIVNILIFVRQGFNDSINISLLGLAIADVSSVLTMFVISLSFNPLFDYSRLSVNVIDVLYLTVGWPHVYFNRVSSFLTTFITLERCICVTLPLKVKAIITPTRTAFVVITIFIFIFVCLSPFYFVNKLGRCYNQFLNRSVIGLVYTENRVKVETATFPIHSVSMPAISLLTVAVCTAILVIQLNKKAIWRNNSAAQTASSKHRSVSAKEKKVVKMVIFLATIFIICYLPSTINFLMMTYEPEFSITGKYVNLYMVIWSLTVFVQIVNSSVNIFVYLRMSTKFRSTFVQTFFACVRNN